MVGNCMKAYPHYKELYPNLPNFPLSHGERGEGFPVEYYLHHSIPQQYRPVFREAASEWNNKVPFEAFIIRDEIDYSDMNSFREVLDSRNVIYWFNKDQHDIEEDADGNFLKMAEVLVKPAPLKPSEPYIFISEADIAIYEEMSTARGRLHTRFTINLRDINVEHPKDMDALGLQSLYVEHLSKMSLDDFYNMVTQSIRKDGLTVPSELSREEIQNAIVQEINANMKDIEPLDSFEDYQDLLIKEYALDVAEIFDDTTMLGNNITHELGHVLGLGHNRAKGSLMEDVLLSKTIVRSLPRHLRVAPQEVDKLAIHGLQCAYDLEYLMQTKPL